MNSLIEQVADFLKDEERVTYIDDGIFRAFIRKGMHLNPELKIVSTLDIANMHCDKPGNKVFTNLINQIEMISPYPIYVESVLDHTRLGIFLIRRGYQSIPLKGINSYYLDPHNSKK